MKCLAICSRPADDGARTQLAKGAAVPKRMPLVVELKEMAAKRLKTVCTGELRGNLVGSFVSLSILECRLMLVQKELGTRMNDEGKRSESNEDGDGCTEEASPSVVEEKGNESKASNLDGGNVETEPVRVFRESQELRRGFMFGRMLSQTTPSSCLPARFYALI